MWFWRHSVHFRFGTNLYLENGWLKSETEWNLGLGVSIQCIQGSADSQVPKVMLASFGAFPIFDKLVSRKTVVKQNEVKFGLGMSVQMYIGYFCYLSG